MSISKYRALAAVAELKNITKASNRLGYTQSGVSHLVSALEDDLGVTLLLRSKSGTTLTEEGMAMLPYVQRVLEDEDALRAKALELRDATVGKLRLATFSSVAIQWLPKILSRFTSLHPGVEVCVTNGTYSTVEDALASGSADCAFVPLPTLPEFTATRLFHDRLLAVVDERNPLAAREDLTAADLTGETFIVPAEGSNHDIGKLFAAAGTHPANTLDINDDYAAVAMVRQRLGVTILPELMLRGFPLDGVKCVPIRDTERAIGVAVRKGRRLPPAVNAFLNTVRDSASYL